MKQVNICKIHYTSSYKNNLMVETKTKILENTNPRRRQTLDTPHHPSVQMLKMLETIQTYYHQHVDDRNNEQHRQVFFVQLQHFHCWEHCHHWDDQKKLFLKNEKKRKNEKKKSI